MKQQNVLQMIAFLLLVCNSHKHAHGSQEHNIELSECVKRNWVCPQCSQFNGHNHDFCAHCAKKREHPQQLLNQETMALIASFGSVWEQVKNKERTALLTPYHAFLTPYQDRTWLCKQCRCYNKKSDYYCNKCGASKYQNQTNQCLDRLRAYGIALLLPKKDQKGGVVIVVLALMLLRSLFVKNTNRQIGKI